MRRTQYGVRYGDGEVEETNGDLEDAQVFITRMRAQIEKYGWDFTYYEPMAVVSRTVVRIEEIGEWEEVPVLLHSPTGQKETE